jgi:hypothetical protein
VLAAGSVLAMGHLGDLDVSDDPLVRQSVGAR